jgi:4-hydroxy-tetrahydrodipicolinate synthase
LPKAYPRKIQGLFTAIISPFDVKGRVDPEAFAKLIRFQVAKGVDGIYACGTTGLAPLLSLEERKSIAETAVEASGGKIPVVVQVGCADTASSIELAKHAEKAGAYAVASLTPYYYKPGERAIAAHFEAISRAVDIPLLAYNIPQFTGNNVSPGMVSSLARKGTILGIKDSSRDLLQLQDMIDLVPEGFVVMNGTEEYGLYAIMSGAAGLVSGGSSALPEVFESMLAAQKKGDYKAAKAAQKRILKVKDAVRQSPIPAYYEILRARGIDCGQPRAPFLPMDQADARQMIQGLKDEDLL